MNKLEKRGNFKSVMKSFKSYISTYSQRQEVQIDCILNPYQIFEFPKSMSRPRQMKALDNYPRRIMLQTIKSIKQKCPLFYLVHPNIHRNSKNKIKLTVLILIKYSKHLLEVIGWNNVDMTFVISKKCTTDERKLGQR